ncbi:MAG TPA: hypothetical protein PKC03_13290 [Dokdonella sp.]|jgi:hypothetical protein|nr:hypothetical protein [Dokdonella sp.]
MMSSTENRALPPGVAALLDRLPEHEPDPALWTRIQSVRAARQLRSRRQRRGWLGAGLAAAAMLCIAVFSRFPLPAGQADDLASWREHSRLLEAQWHTLPGSPVDPRSRAELRLIDSQLQSAYDRGATDSELIPLWKLRSAALQDLIRHDSDRVQAVTRI